jgi:hypothetical protein
MGQDGRVPVMCDDLGRRAADQAAAVIQSLEGRTGVFIGAFTL